MTTNFFYQLFLIIWITGINMKVIQIVGVSFIASLTLKNRPRSPIFELDLDFLRSITIKMKLLASVAIELL